MAKLSVRFVLLAVHGVIITILYFSLNYNDTESFLIAPSVTLGYNGHHYSYNRRSELLFITGYPRSGTTVFQTMIEEHPDIKCTPEHSLNRLLLDITQEKWTAIQRAMYSNSVAQFILTTVIRDPDSSRIICYKEPFLSPHMEYLKWLFPSAKFITLVRDGRAVAASVVKTPRFRRYENLPELSDYEYALRMWNRYMKIMISQCLKIGDDSCMMVFYEIFVNDREYVLREVAEFLQIKYLNWVQRERHPWKFLSSVPFQLLLHSNVSLGINTFYNWMLSQDRIPGNRAEQLAPMLTVLGYDTKNEKPDYTIGSMTEALKKIHRLQQTKGKGYSE